MTLSRSKLCQRWRKLLDGSTRSQASKESLLSRWPLFFPRFERRFGMSSCWGGSLVTYIYFFGFIRSGWFFSLKTGHFEEFSVFFGVISAKVTFNIKKDPKLHIWHIQKKCPSKTSFQKKNVKTFFQHIGKTLGVVEISYIHATGFVTFPATKNPSDPTFCPNRVWVTPTKAEHVSQRCKALRKVRFRKSWWKSRGVDGLFHFHKLVIWWESLVGKDRLSPCLHWKIWSTYIRPNHNISPT